MALSLSAAADAILAYTGLSATAFFTIAALMVGVYVLVSSMFVATASSANTPAAAPPDLPSELFAPPPDPVQLGDITLEELRAYDGSDAKKPLLMAIKREIYDVTRSRMFYGPGGPYALFAGREASRALALMSFDHADLTDNLEGLAPSELEVLQDWESKFNEKYVKVGRVVSEKSEKTHDSGSQSGEDQKEAVGSDIQPAAEEN